MSRRALSRHGAGGGLFESPSLPPAPPSLTLEDVLQAVLLLQHKALAQTLTLAAMATELDKLARSINRAIRAEAP